MFGDIHAIDHSGSLGLDLLHADFGHRSTYRFLGPWRSWFLLFYLSKFLAFQSCYFLFFESVKIGRHNFSFYCVLALAGYFPFVFHFFFNGPSPQSTASGKLFLPSLFSFNLLVPVHMFLCVSFYHSFFSFVPGNLVGWKIWVCTEICFSFHLIVRFSIVSASRYSRLATT